MTKSLDQRLTNLEQLSINSQGDMPTVVLKFADFSGKNRPLESPSKASKEVETIVEPSVLENQVSIDDYLNREGGA